MVLKKEFYIPIYTSNIMEELVHLPVSTINRASDTKLGKSKELLKRIHRSTNHKIQKLNSCKIIRTIMLTAFVWITFLFSKNSVLAAQRDALNLNVLKNIVDIIPKELNNGSYNGVVIGNHIDISSVKEFMGKNVTITKSLNKIILVNTAPTRHHEEETTFTSTDRFVPRKIVHKNTNTGLMNSKEINDDARSGPYFEKSTSKNVTALLGKTAYLNCRVKNLGNKTMLLQVSWVRHRDIHLLTVGRYTYTSDQRFRAIHQPQTEDWILQIKYPQHRDSGIYECQVSTTPHMSHYIHLNVVEPSTEIIGAPDLYIESGSNINLTCIILNSPEPPAYIFWNHNSAIINYDSPRGGVSVVTNKGETTTSFLLIKSARPTDSGHYQCNPSNAKSKSVTVHVLNGEFPAAMQRAGQTYHLMSQNHYLLVYLLMHLLSLVYINVYAHLPSGGAKGYSTKRLY